MCDDQSIDDMNNALRRDPDMSRRHFSALSLATSFLMLLPVAGEAEEVTTADIDIKTPDGVADCYFAHPTRGSHPGVLMWTDVRGLRPAFKMMGQRLAQSGYCVLVPNPFYRLQRAPVMPAATSPQDDEATRKRLMSLGGSLTAATNVTDAKAFVGFLATQRSVDKRRKLGSVGYCMGGPLVMRTAATFPDRVGAGAIFHGANLVTDAADSPHLAIAHMKGSFLIAIAQGDDMRQPQAKDVLRKSFDDRKLQAQVEVYPDTMHGWCPPDSPVYNEAQAERGWSAMLALFGKALA